MEHSIISAVFLPLGRMTRRDVIEEIGGCVPVPLCVRYAVRNMRATAKQRGCEQSTGKWSACLS